ncbi:DUF2855 family protein [Ideonella sp. A 288]|uniref:DUF2855 family protein n=1 Tax=Ideonella sp. A 288 TaxID=1962181 RepID=UPI000B4B8C22|nr:DUF2855 family protein [Ideonella sp. A 288]
MTARNFLVARHDLHRTQVVDDPLASQPLADGQVRMAIVSFGLTANNITYGAFGDAMRYWGFFPSGDPAWGRIPVWGFGDVVESRVDGLAVGERFYGYWPMSHQLVLQPDRLGPGGFTDATACRRDLPLIYNQYVRCSTDPGYAVEHEAHIALLRPLFTTSFLLADFLAEHRAFGAETVLVSSASSKTAYGMAFCLRGSGPRLIGLTSPSHLAFTRSLGCYDEVLPYDAVGTLPSGLPVVYVDFSGSATLRRAVHGHFGDALQHSAAVGGTHWADLAGQERLAGPRPTLFFAPSRAQQRLADWGPVAFRQKLHARWEGFIAALQSADPPWMTVTHSHGAAAVQAVYLRLLDGQLDPTDGQMLSM